MADFNVGDSVTALCNFKTKSGNEIIKGQSYIIQGLLSCECGAIMVDIGSSLQENRFIRCDCSRRFPNGVWWINSKRFTKDGNNDTTEDIKDFMNIFHKQEEKV